ncbi:response regulator [Marinomonas sp. 15G1-11]|uniref:Response regulator n=1 Tax=Marinomonas phaeophyticola TaxID=3004091 RepID=A0ABT4JQL7_9GAMM|nr:response regulator [Marinomonas sp. 15G1-11]MCZ2720683.1 response regulator [Marinomonas sp. 15G1-11]
MNDITTPDFTNLNDLTDANQKGQVKSDAKKKILIIEDLAEMRFMLKSLMSSLGFNDIDLEATGQAALKAVMQKHYDIVLSDYNLGGTIDGQQILEVTRKTYALDHSTIFIMITADTAYESVVSVLEYQPDSYLVKPFPPEAFVRRLKRVQEQKKVFEAVNRLRMEEDFEGVELEAKKIMKKNPSYKNICSKIIGESLYSRGLYKEAKVHYLLILQQNKNLAWAYYGIAQCEFKLGAVAAAAKNLEQTITVSRHYLSAYDLLADAYEKLKQPENAQAALQKAIDVSPKALERSTRLGKLSQKVKDWETAELSFARVVRLARDSSYEKAEIYYDHLKSITDCLAHGIDNGKLMDRFKRSLIRLRTIGKQNPTAISNSYRLEVQQLLTRKYPEEAKKAWLMWHRLIVNGKASAISAAQEKTLKKMLGLL